MLQRALDDEAIDRGEPNETPAVHKLVEGRECRLVLGPAPPSAFRGEAGLLVLLFSIGTDWLICSPEANIMSTGREPRVFHDPYRAFLQ
jgi:hypothetical protein